MDVYQGGTAYQVYSPQGSKPLDSLKIAGGSVRKEYDKASKSQVVVVEQATSKITVPRTATGALLLHPIVVVQLFAAVSSTALTIEFTVVDGLGKRRLMFSNSFGAIQPNPQHTKFPLQGLPRGQWVDLIFDVRQLHRGIYEARAPVGFRGVETVTLSGANCRVRRIYTLRELPPMAGGPAMYHMHVPSQFTLPSDVEQMQVLISRGDELSAAASPPVAAAPPLKQQQQQLANGGGGDGPLPSGGRQQPAAVGKHHPPATAGARGGARQPPPSPQPTTVERRHVDVSMDVAGASQDDNNTALQQRTLHPVGVGMRGGIGSSTSSRLGTGSGRGGGLTSSRLRQPLKDEERNVVQFHAHPALQALHEEKMEAAAAQRPYGHSSTDSNAALQDERASSGGGEAFHRAGGSWMEQQHSSVSPSSWVRTSVPTEVPRRSYLGLVTSPHPSAADRHESSSGSARTSTRRSHHTHEVFMAGTEDDDDEDETFVVRHQNQQQQQPQAVGRSHDATMASIDRNSSDMEQQQGPPSIEGSHRHHRHLRASPPSSGSTLSRPEPLSASLGSGESSGVSVDPNAHCGNNNSAAGLDASTARQLRMSESTVLMGGDTFDTRRNDGDDHDMSAALARAVRAAAQRALQSMPPTMPNVSVHQNAAGGRPSTDGAARKKTMQLGHPSLRQQEHQHPSSATATRDAGGGGGGGCAVAMSLDHHLSAAHHQLHFRADVSPPSTAPGGDRYSTALLSDEEDDAVMCVDPHAFYYPPPPPPAHEAAEGPENAPTVAVAVAAKRDDANRDELAQRVAMLEDAAAQPWVAPPSRRGPSPSPLSPPPPVRISHDLGSSPPHPQALADSSRYEYDPIVGCYFDRVTNRFVKPPQQHNNGAGPIAGAPSSPTGMDVQHHAASSMRLVAADGRVAAADNERSRREVRGLSPGQAHRPPSANTSAV